MPSDQVKLAKYKAKAKYKINSCFLIWVEAHMFQTVNIKPTVNVNPTIQTLTFSILTIRGNITQGEEHRESVQGRKEVLGCNIMPYENCRDQFYWTMLGSGEVSEQGPPAFHWAE